MIQAAVDKRLKLTTELINGIRIVKYYAWEKPFLQNIEKGTLPSLLLLLLFVVITTTTTTYINGDGDDSHNVLFLSLSLSLSLSRAVQRARKS